MIYGFSSYDISKPFDDVEALSTTFDALVDDLSNLHPVEIQLDDATTIILNTPLALIVEIDYVGDTVSIYFHNKTVTLFVDDLGNGKWKIEYYEEVN